MLGSRRKGPSDASRGRPVHPRHPAQLSQDQGCRADADRSGRLAHIPNKNYFTRRTQSFLIPRPSLSSLFELFFSTLCCRRVSRQVHRRVGLTTQQPGLRVRAAPCVQRTGLPVQGVVRDVFGTCSQSPIVKISNINYVINCQHPRHREALASVSSPSYLLIRQL